MENEVKTIQLVYFGKKYPKIIEVVPPENYAQAKEEDRRASEIATKTGKIHQGVSFISLSGPAKVYKFSPFKEIAVEERAAKILLGNAGDIFRKVTESRDPKIDPNIATEGHVGAVHAERIKDLEKTTKAEMKSEKGKSVEQLIGEKEAAADD